MGNDLKEKILIYNGIKLPEEMRKKPSILSCPRCELVNAIENKYCSKCSYPLVPSAFDDLKMEENIKFEKLEKKYEKMNSTLQTIFSILQDIDEQGKRKLAVNLIESGLYTQAKT
jgi:hypothetical protein